MPRFTSHRSVSRLIAALVDDTRQGILHRVPRGARKGLRTGKNQRCASHTQFISSSCRAELQVYVIASGGLQGRPALISEDGQFGAMMQVSLCNDVSKSWPRPKYRVYPHSTPHPYHHTQYPYDAAWHAGSVRVLLTDTGPRDHPSLIPRHS
jgi:hypothetical protein